MFLLYAGLAIEPCGVSQKSFLTCGNRAGCVKKEVKKASVFSFLSCRRVERVAGGLYIPPRMILCVER